MKTDVAKLDLHKPEFVHQFNILLYLDYLEEGMKSKTKHLFKFHVSCNLCQSYIYLFHQFVSLSCQSKKRRIENTNIII